MNLLIIRLVSRLKKLIAILLLFVMSSFMSFQQPPDTGAKIKAVFIYNFSKYFDWPANYKQGNFIVGILGKSSLTNELTTMSSSKTVGSQKFEIKEFETLDAVNKCHILFVPADNGVALTKVINKIKDNSTLLITEKEGYARMGASINFVYVNNKQKFELNKTTAEKHDLKVSSQLETLAIKVD